MSGWPLRGEVALNEPFFGAFFVVVGEGCVCVPSIDRSQSSTNPGPADCGEGT
jgi:hypothetical protein